MIQQMAPLPTSPMMAYEPPFSYMGMDLFGPLYVKHGSGTLSAGAAFSPG